MKIKEFVLVHKRAIKLFLTIFNTLLVVILFSSAALLFYSVSDKSPTIFGCTLVLVKDDISKSATLVFVDKTAKVAPNESFLYMSSDKNGSRVCLVSETAGDMLTFLVNDDAGVPHDISLSISGEEYGGIVKGENKFFGRLFDIFSNRENMPFIYMLIGGICALILLLLILLYFFFQKKDDQSETDSDVRIETNAIEGTDDIPHSEDKSVENSLLAQLPQTHISVKDDGLPPLTAPPIDPNETKPDEKPHRKAFSPKEQAKEPPKPAPAPVWETPFSVKAISTATDDDNEDVPSIESLMDEINLLDNNWDEDLKIYPTKHKK